jgi:hypothetical protein
LIALGLFTRVAAFICSGEMAAVYFMVDAPKSFWPALNQVDAAILFTFVFLYLAFAGPGAWSLDAIFRRSAAAAPQPDAELSEYSADDEITVFLVQRASRIPSLVGSNPRSTRTMRKRHPLRP